MGLRFCLASFFAATQALALGSDASEQDGGGLVVGVLGDEFATKGFGEDGLVELF